MQRKAKYICFEGSEGTGKSTQSKLLKKLYSKMKKKVLLTKEPGTPHNKLTMKLRKLALDARNEPSMTVTAREYLMQANRSVHIEKVINPALEKMDLIIQDRGMLSGITYGVSCGVSHEDMMFMCQLTNQKKPLKELYDLIIVFEGNTDAGLARAKSAKQEFKGGDAMEMKPREFFDDIKSNFEKYSKLFKHVEIINVEGKDIPTVTKELESIINKYL